ncbi:hypothetical protein ABBQ32_002153 [Trebouxia sp. C0010 RCD-2024]
MHPLVVRWKVCNVVSPACPTNAAGTSVNLKQVLDALEPIKQVCMERLARTRSAPNISKNLLQEVEQLPEAGPHRLRAALLNVLTVLHNMAMDPTSDAWSTPTAECAAWLSFRELIFSYSSFHREGEVGECTAAALAANGVHGVKVKPPRVTPTSKQYGVPAQPGPDLGIEYRHVHYVSKLPGSRRAFEKQLAQFYSQHGAVLSPVSILRVPLDCYTVFKAVAARGGFEGVSGTRQWLMVARQWRPEVGVIEARHVRKAYRKLLLAFEQQLSQHCKAEVRKVEVRQKKGTRVRRAGPSGSIEPHDQPAKASKKRKAPSDTPGEWDFEVEKAEGVP